MICLTRLPAVCFFTQNSHEINIPGMRNQAVLEVVLGLGDTDTLSLSLSLSPCLVPCRSVSGVVCPVCSSLLLLPLHREDTLKHSYLQVCEYFARRSEKVVNYSNLTTVGKNNTSFPRRLPEPAGPPTQTPTMPNS